jgi:hypothetical protein
MEQFANQCSTFTMGGYVAGSGVLNVVSTGAPWPATGTFTIQLQNASLTLLRVIAVTSSTQWAVVAESNDLNTDDGTTILGTVLSAQALDQMKQDMFDMANFVHYQTPTVTGYNWVNQGTATITQNVRSLTLTTLNDGGGGGDDMHIFKTAVPSAPYTFSALIGHNGPMQFYVRYGIIVGDSSGKLVVLMHDAGYNCTFARYYNSPSSYSGEIVANYGQNSNYILQQMWSQITDDGTNLTLQYSYDGISWFTVTTVSRSAFLSVPSVVGVFAETINGAIGQSFTIKSMGFK